MKAVDSECLLCFLTPRSLAAERDPGVGSPTCQAWPACPWVGMWATWGVHLETGGPCQPMHTASGRVRREVLSLGTSWPPNSLPSSGPEGVDLLGAVSWGQSAVSSPSCSGRPVCPTEDPRASPGNQGRRGPLAMLAEGRGPGTVSVPTGPVPELGLGAPAGLGQCPGSWPLSSGPGPVSSPSGGVKHPTLPTPTAARGSFQHTDITRSPLPQGLCGF